MKAFGILLWIVVIALVVAAVLLLRRERRDVKGFDERQLALRAAGYKKGFFVTLVAEMLALVLIESGVIPAASATLTVFVALMAGVGTFAVFCIVKDVYFRIGEKGNSYRILCAVIVVLDGVTAVIKIVDGTILENGVPTFSSCSALVMTLVFLVILAALLVRKPPREEDDE